jgi:hypothetical protein
VCTKHFLNNLYQVSFDLFQTGSRSWCFQLKDKNDQTISLGITSAINFMFDLFLVILTDLSDSSSSNLFITPYQGVLTVLLKCNLKQTKLSVQVYGLKTMCTKLGQYDQVVCCGDNKADCKYIYYIYKNQNKKKPCTFLKYKTMLLLLVGVGFFMFIVAFRIVRITQFFLPMRSLSNEVNCIKRTFDM